MDKNNDIKVNKISKWDGAPENMGTLFTYIDMVIGMACSLPSEIHDNLYDLMDKTLDEYNELEAIYKEVCGEVSRYEGKTFDELKQHYEEELRIREKEIEELTNENRVFRLKNLINRTYGLTGQIELLNKEIDAKNKFIDELNQTAWHECEELHEKIETLEKENNELKQILAMCERDANMARELCHTVAFNAERARNKTPRFNDTYEEEK